MIAKLTSKLLAFFSASTAEAFSDSLADFLGKAQAFFTANEKTAANVSALESSFGEMKAQLKTANDTIAAQAGKITALETTVGNPATMTEARIIQLAKDSGSQAATAAVSGAAAGTPAAAAPASPVQANATTTLIEQGKYAEAYDADKNIRAEFPTPGSYVAFMKAQKNGQVRLK